MLHTYRHLTTAQEGWWIMPDPVPEQPWEVRVAYKKGREVRMAYYDRLLRSMMEMIEGTVKIMKANGMSEAVEYLGRALLTIEDAWATLAVEDAWATLAVEEASALVARQRETEPCGLEGEKQADE